ncbi:calcium-activated chloride channel-domain-containing protein [Multifurca ochricompacta]|uniref:Calcium-activated chloride channel-domain-containing protein n=1 Tax=Multifurca ochricompacta TaxID=376703 RepID=A0AAD4QNN5_9AGAM|nr:calcium-activated chloride channel-domain-containing protein [Multifurca ochricompacta]
MRDIDLVIVFRASSSSLLLSKQQARLDAQQAEDQYTRLLETLRNAGLYAVGRRGERQGQLILLVSCSGHQLKQLLQRERQDTYLFIQSIHFSLTLITFAATSALKTDSTVFRPSERLRLVHSYVTASSSDGGLGIHPDNDAWPRIESIMALHDPEFNNFWIRSLTTSSVGHDKLDTIRAHFGEAVSLYFAFLASYTRALLFISAAGLATYFFGQAYSIIYSSLLFVWSVIFVEYWRIRERLYSVAWGCLGSVRVERFRPRSLKRPIIALFASVLAGLLTAFFIFEAFVTTLYTGPGHEYISLAPTVIFAAVIPRFLTIYRTYAQRLTQWENHKHQSTFDASLTIKTFSLSSIVAYLGLGLSAFIYVPFGETAINYVQHFLFLTSDTVSSLASSSGLSASNEKGGRAFFVSDKGAAHAKLNRSRLQNQMFAYTVTNQAINFFLEVGLPFLTRAFASVRSGKRRPSLSVTAKKKRVGFDDEKSGAARDEREFLERVRREVSLPEYDLFEDYDEMANQFGYVALWSTIWPLAPVMALLNNVVEFRSDAFKIVTHFRRPLPKRIDTIGPWLDCLSFLSWLSALTNSALVYLFRPTAAAAGSSSPSAFVADVKTETVLLRALFIALAASHGYIILRAGVRHVLERVLWVGSAEKACMDEAAREVKEQHLQSVRVTAGLAAPAPGLAVEEPTASSPPPPGEFWQFDEGLDEIRKGIKEA